ncbi:MAG: hypothetical protein JM58_14710 [Peptococcaceae bacterium BICA1-8]|nr:MAG: hypothetical protein JM58_14710 [Peptococcaceae bacterium BICA1-8]
MMIKTFKCESLGGIAKKELHLSDGLNVVLGPNEAGKSTMIDGLFSVFFRNSRLKNNQSDKDFANRFRPYPNGDSMKGSVLFDAGENHYEISKEWGARPSAYLNLNGQLISDENTISEKLKEVLLYGENTYNNVIFAKQKDIKESLEKMSKDQETSHILGDLLRKAVMVLDGLSLEKLKIKIDEELNKYQSRWDVLNNRPEGNKGVNQPWKKGIGVVLEAFYHKEMLNKDMEEAQQVEKEYAIAVENLKKVIEQKTKVKLEIDQYSGIEKDIFQRALLEPRTKTLEVEIIDLKVVAKEFPVKEAMLKDKLGEVDNLSYKTNELSAELDRAKKINDAKQIEKLLDKMSLREQEINNKLKQKEQNFVSHQE